MSGGPPPFNPNVDPVKGMGEAPPPYPGAGMPAPPPPGFNPPPGQPGNVSFPPPGTTAYPQPPPPAGYPQPQQGYAVQAGHSTVYSQGPVTTTTVVVTGNCPRCHVGNLIEESNTGGLVFIIILVILFFPIGLLYLLCLPGTNERRCPNCGYHTD